MHETSQTYTSRRLLCCVPFHGWWFGPAVCLSPPCLALALPCLSSLTPSRLLPVMLVTGTASISRNHRTNQNCSVCSSRFFFFFFPIKDCTRYWHSRFIKFQRKQNKCHRRDLICVFKSVKMNKQLQKLHIVSSNFILKNICKGYISKASLERSGATVQLLFNLWPHSWNSASWCTFLQLSTGKISCFWFKVLQIWESAECQKQMSECEDS